MAVVDRRALVVVVAMVVGSLWAWPAPAQAVPVPPPWIAAMDAPGGLIIASDTTADPAAVAVTSTPFGGLPRTGSNYLLLSTGDVSGMFGSPSAFTSTDLAAAPAGVDGNDLTQLRMTLVPEFQATCLAFDFFFASEEFPEFVDTEYNDTFTAELNTSAWSLDDTQLIAPNNFAFDPEGNAISVNTVLGLTELAGTTMDGTTPALTAVTPLERQPGNNVVELILSLQDLGDSIYDTAVGIDNFRWLYGPDCERGTSPLTDTDGDALPDHWETEGIDYDSDGTPELDLPAMGADPQHKDLFLEADWMFEAPTCNGGVCVGGEDFAPLPDAVSDVVAAFAAAPVPNPDGATGIRVHFDAGPGSVMNPVTGATWGSRSRATAVPHVPVLGTGGTEETGPYNWTAFDAIKLTRLEPVRQDAFHYIVYADRYGVPEQGSSGISRALPASDMIVSDGHDSWGTGFSRTQERGTIMHELGHNLGLSHGGNDGRNNEPNYLSIMSYSFQLVGVLPGDRLDYSRETLSPLDEAALSEAAGLDPDGLLAGLGTRWACGETNAPATNVDWNCSGAINPGTVASNVNFDFTGGPSPQPIISTLTGFDDWDNLQFDGGSIGDLGDSQPLPVTTEVEPSVVEVAKEIGAFAKPGDGTVEVVGPTLLLPDTGDQNVVLDVTNISAANGSYEVDVESDLPFTDTDAALSAPAGATRRARLAVDTDDLAPGEYPVTAHLSATPGGAELHEHVATITVPDLDDPAVRADVAAAVDEVAAMPDSGPLDPEVRDQIVAMAAEAGIGHETVELTITPTGNPAAAFVVRGPVTGGSVNVTDSLLGGPPPTVNGQGTIATASGPATFRLSHVPVLGLLSIGSVEVTLPNGQRWTAATPLGLPAYVGSDGAAGTFQGWRSGSGTIRIAYEVRDRP